MTTDYTAPITTDGVDRRWQMCQCAKCREIKQCTPQNDFYAEKDGSLSCESCFWASLRDEGYQRLPDVLVKGGMTDER